MNPWMLVASAVALAIERVAYGVIWHRPDLFTRFCRRVAPSRDPVGVLAALFVGFKGIQAVVFLAWCSVHGGIAARDSGEVPLLVSGMGLVAAGQILNVSVFLRLGRTGVFYGNKLGHDVPWCEGFPFSAIRHPQYVGHDALHLGDLRPDEIPRARLGGTPAARDAVLRHRISCRTGRGQGGAHP